MVIRHDLVEWQQQKGRHGADALLLRDEERAPRRRSGRSFTLRSDTRLKWARSTTMTPRTRAENAGRARSVDQTSSSSCKRSQSLLSSWCCCCFQPSPNPKASVAVDFYLQEQSIVVGALAGCCVLLVIDFCSFCQTARIFIVLIQSRLWMRMRTAGGRLPTARLT